VILPLAVVSREPMEEYQQQHSNIVDSLKHNVSDALTLYYELENLRTQVTNGTDKISKLHDKKLDLVIREKEERLFRLIKFSDYPALTMAAYPDAKFISNFDYKRTRDTIPDPILVRGITSGGHIKHAQENGRDYYFMETGYLGNYRSPNNTTGRKVYHRIEKNDMQQNRIMDVSNDRWNALCKFNPALVYQGWRKKPGSKILLIMSTDKPFEYYGHSREEWVEQTISTLKAHTDREIVIRDKAGRGERTNDTIYEALDNDIWALVTYNSIAAVEAIQSGIPAFSIAPTAASVVSSTDLTQIEAPPKPDKELIQRWLWSIAYGQFTINELLTGEAWRLVQENDSRPTLSY
jgi:hypothetical protein